MAKRSRKKRNPVEKAIVYVNNLKVELATLELKLLLKKKVESAHGSELSEGINYAILIFLVFDEMNYRASSSRFWVKIGEYPCPYI